MRRVFSFAVMLCALTAPRAGAQTLTMAQAIDEALRHNLSLLAERSQLTIAEAQMVGARLRPNPVVSFSADHLDVLGTGFDEANNGGPPEIAWRIDVPFERGGKRDARVALASLIRSAAEAQFADAVRTLSEDVTLACIDLLTAQATRALAADVRSALHEYETTRDLVAGIERDLLKPAEHARDISAYTYKAGGATLLELLDAQRAFNDTMQSYVDAQAALRRASARLNAAVGTEVVR